MYFETQLASGLQKNCARDGYKRVAFTASGSEQLDRDFVCFLYCLCPFLSALYMSIPSWLPGTRT